MNERDAPCVQIDVRIRTGMRGTPLKKFGPYQLRQTGRGENAVWGVFDTRTKERVVFSFCRESADFVAARLASGNPVQTPHAHLEHCLSHYASVFGSRFAHYKHTYLAGGTGLRWIHGGLVSEDVTFLTEKGAALWLAAQARERAERQEQRRTLRALAEDLDSIPLERVASLHALLTPEDPDPLAAYRAGTWPDAAGSCMLSPIHEGSEEFTPLGVLLSATFPIDPAWLDDARTAVRHLLAHGQNPEEDGTDSRAVLLAWASRLTAKYGGVWSPTTEGP